MSKGSGRRPGSGYEDGYDRIWGHLPKVDENDHMKFIDKPEDITPGRLRFMCHSLTSVGMDYEARVIHWVADLLEQKP